MALLLREAMRVGRVSYHPNFFSVSLGAHAAKKRLGDEIRNFSVVVEAPKTHFAKTRKTLVLSPLILCISLRCIRISELVCFFTLAGTRASWEVYKTTL